MSPSARSPLRSLSPEIPEQPPLTASSLASATLKEELDLHHRDDSSATTETIVILQDSCYGHRYSRPRTSRAALATIVERPERIKAGVLGLSTAYVRLGERHADGAYPPHPKRDMASIPSIPFRIKKTDRRLSIMSATVTNVHGTKWMEELKIMCDTAESKLAMNGKELQRPEMNRGHDHEAPTKLHEGDLYLCSESLEALEGALGAVCEAVDTVFKPDGPRRAFVAIRPPGHHCSAVHPSGFCWLNNVHVGIMHGILGHGLTHAAIIDFDLHHGDGSQSIAWQHNSRGVGLAKNAAWWKKTSIGYFSLHDINSYPCEMGDEEKVKNASLCIENAHGQNIWNVHLEPWKSESDFWKLYESKYSILLEKARKFLKAQTERLKSANQNSKAAIFFSAGFDASEWEGAGMQRHKVNVPTEFYARIARDVTKIAAEEDTSVDGRIISVLEGGYSDRALTSGVLSHISGLAGEDPVPTKEQDYNGLGLEMGQRIGAVHSRKSSLAVPKPKARPYDSAWWAAGELEELENSMAPPPEVKKPRSSLPPTYSSPTQASQAKVVAVPRIRRSVSGMGSSSGGVSRPPSPPPPEVPWTTAAHELYKLLVPTDRPTSSCTHEDLAAEATKARRDRQSALNGAHPTAHGGAPAPTRMALRERKPVRPIPSINEEDEKKHRRKTVAGSSVHASEKAVSRSGTPVPAGRTTGKQAGRRLSAASTIVSETPDPGANLSVPAIGTTLPMRPDTSMSVRTTTGGHLAVKKTRPAASTSKKEAPAPRVPRTKKHVVPTSKDTAAPTSSTGATNQGSKTTTEKSGDELEKITSGMKRIKINLVTKAQREAREREARENSTKSTVASPSGEATLTVSVPGQDEITLQTPGDGITASAAPVDVPELAQSRDPSASTSNGAITPSEGQTPVLSPLEPHQLPLPATSPVFPPTPTEAATPDVFIPYQPEGPSPAAIPHQQRLEWLAPNTGTPSPMKRADLPVFTSTSTIPFAPRAADAATASQPGVPVKPERKVPQSVWDVPETPQK
ncbi:Histone deacetylase [Pleurostoma richardsiae]|uniref:Histone deacetylase n=1 Tax=Pleurostoma richardsiae TaxID=41990 RepID=A0AA38VH72_9PEZI|nr:Histone deacetylase [Pleurostoma richardsiae]